MMQKTIPSVIIGLLLLFSFTGCIDVIERVTIARDKSATLSVTYDLDFHSLGGSDPGDTSGAAKAYSDIEDSLKSEFLGRKKLLERIASYKDFTMGSVKSDTELTFTVRTELTDFHDLSVAHDILFDRHSGNPGDFPVRILVGKKDSHGRESIEFLSVDDPGRSGHGKSKEDFVEGIRGKSYIYSIETSKIVTKMGKGKKLSDNAIEWRTPITDLIIGKKNAVTGGIFFTLE